MTEIKLKIHLKQTEEIEIEEVIKLRQEIVSEI
jgi:hypothetical protein